MSGQTIRPSTEPAAKDPAATATSPAHASYLAQRTFGALDGLRAFSILAVLWHHTYEAPTGWRATERGFLGVDLFFVISGFLIVTLLLREQDRHGRISLKNFYVRRSLRIFPVYYGLLFFLLIVFMTVGRQASMKDGFFHDLPWAMTYTSNWVGLVTFLEITWSLSAEEQFYLIWPPLQRWARRFVVPLLLVLLVLSQVIHFRLAEPVMSALGFAPHQPEMLRQTGFSPIMLGVLLAHGLHSPRWHDRLRQLLGGRAVPVAALAGVLIVASYPGDDITGWPRLLIHLLMTVLVGAAVVREDHLLMPVLRLRPLVRIGALSYGIYLFHMMCRHIAVALLLRIGEHHLIVRAALTLAVTYVVAEVSFRFYETRFLRLKDRFSG
jgi:peptidoglycan/LPS O-acetylase OafA/YrhL